MNESAILAQLAAQQAFFSEGQTRPVQSRLDALRRLRRGIHTMKAELCAALRKDLGKSSSESYLCEIGTALSELRFMLKHAPGLAKPRRLPISMPQFPGQGCSLPIPYGQVLILSPWNYPLLLALQPAIDAIAAGNTVVIKPSELAPATARAVEKLISETLPPELALVISGGHEESRFLLEQPFDSIFFTGSTRTGRLIMEQAAKHLTPVTLELGGKSPCIVDETANLSLAARRIVFGKFLNCGQTCVAPDYLLVHHSVEAPLLAAIQREITRQFGPDPLANPNYGKIINQQHFERLFRLIDRDKLFLGGEANPSTLQIAPTVLDKVSHADPVMQEEIFGPILPVLVYQDLSEVMRRLSRRPHPLALYLFSENKAVQRTLTEQIPFGGGCVNDTILHVASSHMPFGGVGESGMGTYHGTAGFSAFTHYKSILKKSVLGDFSMRYPPYTPQKDRLIRRFLR